MNITDINEQKRIRIKLSKDNFNFYIGHFLNKHSKSKLLNNVIEYIILNKGKNLLVNSLIENNFNHKPYIINETYKTIQVSLKIDLYKEYVKYKNQLNKDVNIYFNFIRFLIFGEIDTEKQDKIIKYVK